MTSTLQKTELSKSLLPPLPSVPISPTPFYTFSRQVRFEQERTKETENLLSLRHRNTAHDINAPVNRTS